MEKLINLISEQQRGHENEPAYMIGEQLKEIAEREPSVIDILVKDLETNGMGLEDVAAKFKQYADKNHGSAKCFCITPKVAEDLIREFYGLPKAEEKTFMVAKTKNERMENKINADFIDIDSLFEEI
ncbi:MAG: hypothetical protein IJW19_05125 [Clostridia bacterium]|nr:hypothetical protein [Clostridia bacterium]